MGMRLAAWGYKSPGLALRRSQSSNVLHRHGPDSMVLGTGLRKAWTRCQGPAAPKGKGASAIAEQTGQGLASQCPWGTANGQAWRSWLESTKGWNHQESLL